MKNLLTFLLLTISIATFGQSSYIRERNTVDADKAKAVVEKFINTLLKDSNDSLINLMSTPFAVVDGDFVYQANSNDSLPECLSQMKSILRKNNCQNIITCKISNSFGDDDERELYFFDIVLNTNSKKKIKLNICAKMFERPLLKQFKIE